MTDAEGQRRKPGRPALISREKIVEAVAAAPNLDALTMRQLAASLGVSHVALYRWVKNRDELFDLVSATVIDRIIEAGQETPEPGERLVRIGWALHDQFLALPGFATHLSRPHRHHAPSLDRLRSEVVACFVELGGVAGRNRDMLAEQSWQVLITCTVGWLAAVEAPLDVGTPPSFGQFLGVLLAGLPVRPDGVRRP